MDDHSVDLLSGEAKFITGQSVSKTESHLGQLFLSKTCDHVAELETKSLEEILAVRDAFNCELISDSLAELLVSN